MVFRLVGAIVGSAGAFVGVYCKNKESLYLRAYKGSNSDFTTISAKWDYNWDKREPKSLVCPLKNDSAEEQNRYNRELEAAKPKAKRIYILVRHGQFEYKNPTDEQRYLTALGRKQADATGRYLASLSLPFTQVVHSTMTRAVETAQLILPHLPKDIPVKTSNLLREGSPHLPEPRNSFYRPEMRYYIDGAQIEAAFRRYVHRAAPSQEKDSYQVIVCHGNVIRYFVCRALQVPPEAWIRFSLRHCSTTWITVYPTGEVSVGAVGDAGHLSKDLLSN